MSEAAALVVATAEVDGQALALSRWGEGSVLDHILDTIRRAGIDHIVVVVGPAAEAIAAEIELNDITVVVDPEWEEGSAASLRCGLDELMRSGGSEDVALLTVAQPQVEPDVLATVVAARREAGTPAAVPKYRYATGLPFAIHHDVWPRLMGLEGAATAEALLKAHPEWVREVWLDRLQPATVAGADDLAAIAPRI